MNIDPIRDLEIIETEMKLADLESIQKRLDKKNRKNIDEKQIKILELTSEIINKGENTNIINQNFEEKDLKLSGLLSIKPKIFVCNVDENSISQGNKYTSEVINHYGEDNTIIEKYSLEHSTNKNGIFLNLSMLDIDIIDDIFFHFTNSLKKEEIIAKKEKIIMIINSLF